MLRSSEAVDAIAAALAKAQTELLNPEKSLVAELPGDRGRASQTYRYASLADGLDIARKTLGRHEVATIQATYVDQEHSRITLTTTLAHSSGQWVASDWPVCSMAELSSPRRMGAALTYARRYSLFTLVGLAGEDDLDDPSDQTHPATDGRHHSQKAVVPLSSAVNPSMSEVQSPAEKSQAQRDRLLEQARVISSLDEVGKWARQTMPIKNALSADHAREVEAVIEGKMEALRTELAKTEFRPNRRETKSETLKSEGVVDQSPMAIVHPVRHRDRAHLRFVMSQPCLLCGRTPSDAHHLRFAQTRGLGLKVSDEFTVPLCRLHHRDLHRSGRELKWWEAIDRDVDPLEVARGLWEQSRTRSQ